MLKARTPWQVTRAVWHAMFMRELVARTMADRMAWFWMLAEPIAIVSLMLFIRTVVFGRTRVLMNAEFVPWLIVGLMGFILFRATMMQSLAAVSMNSSLFAYRQVKPVDTVLVRCYLEFALRSFIFILFILGGVLLELGLLADLPIEALFSWISLWMLGLGLGLVFSVLANLVNEIGIIVRVMSVPLLLLSFVIKPIYWVPHNLLPYVLMNPIVHGLETLRMSFFKDYVSVPGIDLLYLWYWALSSILLGLILHKYFEPKLKQK